MEERSIATVGFSICSKDVDDVDFMSNQSLLDYDIILLRPKIDSFITSSSSNWLGKPCLSEDMASKIKEQIRHWQREIKEAVNNNKLVIVYLTEIKKVIFTGGLSFIMGASNDVISECNNYDFIPVKLNLDEAEGREIKLSATNSDIISSYWKEFSEYSRYKVTLEEDFPSCLVTKDEKKIVGAIFRSENSDGALILLPDIDFYPPKHFDKEESKNKESAQFAAKLIESVVTINRNLQSDGTPEPEWAKDEEFKLEKEKVAEEKLQAIEDNIEEMQAKKEVIEEEIKNFSRLRKLLFEKGKPLELAVLDALRILGFDDVDSFDDGESEFDAVFESDEAKFIGEVGGKDDGPIDIKKFRQLIHNLKNCKNVKKKTKGVLFGNAYRLLPLFKRKETFTKKCISSLDEDPVALVSTPDLFEVAKYLSDNPADKDFATKCRDTLFKRVGRVEFPEIPSSGQNSNKTSQEN